LVLVLEQLCLSAATEDITPPKPFPLAGHSGRRNPFKRVHDPLELNGILLRQGHRAIVLVTADLLYVTEDLEKAALHVLKNKWGLEDVTVLLGASHTHFAPSVDASKPALGRTIAEYESFVRERLAALMDKLATDPGVPVDLHYAFGEASHAVNRRRLGWQVRREGIKHTTAMVPNPKGPKDETVRLITLRNAEGIPLGAIWNYACHPTGFPDLSAVTSEYPGVVRAALRRAVGQPNFPVLFFQGFAGNIRPPAYDQSKRPVMVVRRFLNGTAFGSFTPEQYEAWSTSLAERVVPLLQGNKMGPAELKHTSARLPLDTILSGAPKDRTLRVDTLALASGVRLVSLSAEVMAEYMPRLRPIFAPDQLIPVGYTGWVFGYLPTRDMLFEGGYEVCGFLPLFNLSGHFEKSVEERVVGLVRKAARNGVEGTPKPTRAGKERLGSNNLATARD
jgi:hypothetical protein